MSRGSRVRLFHKEVDAGGPRACCRYLGRINHRKECNTRKEAEEDKEITDLSAMAK